LPGITWSSTQAAAERPAVLVAFDLLQLGATDLTVHGLDSRRLQLEDLLSARQPCVQLVLQTADFDVAREWLTLLPSIEGVVAKRGDGRYEPGRRRDWVKIKRYRTVDCVVIGVTDNTAAPALVLGLRHSDDTIHHLRKS
jgi:ATP-dependent DNA ligase